jgi:hypothetical protein
LSGSLGSEPIRLAGHTRSDLKKWTIFWTGVARKDAGPGIGSGRRDFNAVTSRTCFLSSATEEYDNAGFMRLPVRVFLVPSEMKGNRSNGSTFIAV